MSNISQTLPTVVGLVFFVPLGWAVLAGIVLGYAEHHWGWQAPWIVCFAVAACVLYLPWLTFLEYMRVLQYPPRLLHPNSLLIVVMVYLMYRACIIFFQLETGAIKPLHARR